MTTEYVLASSVFDPTIESMSTEWKLVNAKNDHIIKNTQHPTTENMYKYNILSPHHLSGASRDTNWLMYIRLQCDTPALSCLQINVYYFFLLKF